MEFIASFASSLGLPRHQVTVATGTILEVTKLSLNNWLIAFHFRRSGQVGNCLFFADEAFRDKPMHGTTACQQDPERIEH
ncbi:hypothetical protein [Synechococcus lacustris]|uniref:hypothetical protein n=1 Tax=Synechococcus lacustris TaxID=2116544 RepID=UPI00137A240E|nr:hypothetical protein [Synechococcus lacustris]